MSDLQVSLANTDQEIARCYPVMAQLRPHLDETQFCNAARRLMTQGYQLAYGQHGGTVVTVAGFWVKETLSRGKLVYVDDLVSDERVRSQGHGAAMIEWLAEYGRDKGCQSLEVESSVQRFEAHRFYFAQGLHIARYLFALRGDAFVK